MKKPRNQYSAAFKFQVALAAARGDRTINELASEHSVHPNQVSQWKQHLLEEGATVFARGTQRRQREQEAQETDLFEQIGRLKMELEWVKKKALPDSLEVKRTMIELNHAKISVRRQCELIGLHRSTLYYLPAPETPLNLELLRRIDQQYTKTPFYGWPRMTAQLQRQGSAINPKRVRRLMQLMGLQAIYPQPRTSQRGTAVTVYPYLLRDLEVVRPNQIWSADITYVPVIGGFMYLIAILDWFSRYVLAWQLSNTLDGYFCVKTLEQALRGGQPEIFNTDQGVQFTARSFTSTLEAAGVRISMDGRGRVFDNIFVERLWRTVKYEDIYLHDYGSVPALQAGLHKYFTFYNQERLHQSLGYRTPAEVHLGVAEAGAKVHLNLCNSWS
ncbi:IS3 family transposase [Candidatus Acetothermia bacterium]|nr:IS3 family transposase [Candidatus Acetothermia bacterium]